MDYDVIVIGGGTAGLGAYRKAISLGKKALIIESGRFVTTCASVGCMPSKLLIAAADNMAEIKKSSQFGINVSDIEIDNKVLWSRIRMERDRFVGFVEKGADSIENKIIGHAVFKDQHTIVVNEKEITAHTIVIATGSRPHIPEIFENIKNEILTNENIFELESLPKSVAVFGAGVIGLELGFALHNLEVEITLFNRNKNLLNLGAEVNDYVVKHIEDSFPFIYQENVTKVEKHNEGYNIYYGETVLWVEKILVATGRRPNLDNLGLHNIESLDHKNMLNLYNPLTTQIGDLPLFLAGDVNNELTLLHEASREGLIAGENAANYPIVKDYKRNVFMGIVFTHPQIMQVGETKKLENTMTGSVSFEDQGRSRVMLKNKGLLNVYIDKDSHKLIGAEMIGPDAEHVAHMLAWLIERETTLEQALELPYYHPVIEEGIRTAFRVAALKLVDK
jgi:dihydrolipoamide dehydrogenase